MNCNCPKAYPLLQCIETLQIGVVDPGLTDLTIQFECVITGRIMRIEGVNPQADGLLTVDVSTLSNFFSPRLEIELKVLASLETTGDVVPVNVTNSTFECVLLNFVEGETELASIALMDYAVQQLKFTTFPEGRGLGVAIEPVFDGVFIADYGDGSKRVLYSGYSNTYEYPDIGEYDGIIRGRFQDMTALDMHASKMGVIVLPSTHSIIDLDVSENRLSVDSVNDMLINLDNNGFSNGIALLSTQTPAAPPDGFGATAKANLIAKGWTVTTD